MPARPQILTTLQASRGIAAMAVVLAHVGTVLALKADHDPFGAVLRAGHAGVDFFFVLSGFIITMVHGGEFGQPSRLEDYAWKRLVRIYPIYWIATGIALTLNPVNPGRIGLLASLLLAPQHHEPVLGVAWTLEHEILFYAIFGLLILHRMIGMIVLIAWLSFVVVMMPFETRSDLPWAPADLMTGFVGSSYNLEFGLGMIVAFLVINDRVPFPRTVFATGVTGLLVTGAAETMGTIDYLGQAGRASFGLSAAMVIGGIVAAERAGTLRAGRCLVFVGSASYSIYLIHVPMMMAMTSLVVIRGLPLWISGVALMLIGVGSGLALHAAVEGPGLRLLHAWRRPRIRRGVA
jgi:exopolysaccharide production protein ExoZ